MTERTKHHISGIRRKLSPEDRAIVRQIHKEYLKVRRERDALDSMMLDLMDRREQLLALEISLGPKATAEKFECSHQCIIYILRPRSSGQI